MQDEARMQSQPANVAAYPQFCGSWPNDEWPEDAPIYQYGCFVELCTEFPVGHRVVAEKASSNIDPVPQLSNRLSLDEDSVF